MDYHFYFSIFLLLPLTALPPSLSQKPPSPPPPDYSLCLKPYECGGLSGIVYPFWGKDRPHYCGGGDQFYLTCQQPELESGGEYMSYTTIQMGSPKFEVIGINLTAYNLTISPLATSDVCSPDYKFSLSPAFSYKETVHNITLFYDCSYEGTDGGHNLTMCGDRGVFYYEGAEAGVLGSHPELKGCKHTQVPAEAVLDRNPEDGVSGKGFEVNYTVSEECKPCLTSRGACGSNDTAPYQFSCHCPDGRSYASRCPGNIPNHKSNHGLKLGAIIGIGVGAVVGVVAVCMAIYFYQRRKKTTHYEISYVQSRSLSSDPSLKDTEKGSKYFGVPLFTYTELEEATNNFDSSRELGDGGFGTVYFGKLQDGRCVAVKRLYENNYKRVEQFGNEVQILAGLRHPNLVSLYGCTSRHSRELLLVYEYIPNGTVADHLHGERAKSSTLPWHIRMKIAVETATALTYLHAKDIIHRDVKTNNILLDNHFVVKVADFGLSRLFPNNVTHISTAPQGTPGYVDPEYHECYQLTDKSDVYSFGVVLAELISSLPAVDITRHRHEINLANMAINKIHNQALHELVDRNLGFESDFKVRKMINAVAELAFQCLQSSKDMRPSMEEVVDTLKDIQSDGKHKSQPEVMDITGDDVVLLKDDPPPPSPESNALSKSTTPNASG